MKLSRLFLFPNNGNALAVYDASLESLDNAMAQQQAAGIDTSALTALKTQLESALSEAGQVQASITTKNLTPGNTAPSVGDLFIQYADTISVDNMPSFAEFERMYNEGGAAWDELTLKIKFKEALRSGEVEPLMSFEEYKTMVEEGGKGTGDMVELDQAKSRNDYRKYWTAEIVYNGVKVYQRNDIFNPYDKDARGRTNIQRMKMGLAPIGADGNPVNLHHMLQTNDGSIAEVIQSFHQQSKNIIHINPNTIPSGIDRNQFNIWKNGYWKYRATGVNGLGSNK